MDHAIRGIKLVYGNRRLRRFVWVPLGVAFVVYLSAVLFGFFIAVPFLAAWAATVGVNEVMGRIGGTVVWALLWWFVSGPVILAVATMVSAPGWEKLVGEVEGVVFGVETGKPSPLLAGLLDAALRLPVTLTIGLCIALLGWTFAGFTGILMAGLLGLVEYTAPAFARRGSRFPRQPLQALRTRGAWSFGLAAGLASLIPLVNVLLMPGLVAGGALMLAESERPLPTKA